MAKKQNQPKEMKEKIKNKKVNKQDIPKSKRVKRGVLKASAVVLSLATAVVGVYTILKFTLGETNQTSAPGSDIASHRIEHELTNDESKEYEFDNSQEIDLTEQNQSKGDAYYEQNININDQKEGEEVKTNPHHQRGSNFDENSNGNLIPSKEAESAEK